MPADKSVEITSGCGECEKSHQASPSRRSFLGGLMVAGGAAVGAVLAIPLIRFTIHPLLANTTNIGWSDLGKINEFSSLSAPVKKLITVEQRDGWRKNISEKAVYVVKDSRGELAVLSSVCTHLGCTVPWIEKESKFICPCHIGVFSPQGKLLSGPPRRDMDQLDSKIEDGTLKVRYQYFRQLSPAKESIG